jgi:hypothetical protein
MTDITPSPEFMEVVGRAQGMYGKISLEALRRADLDIIRKGDSVCVGMESSEAKHRAVAAIFPHLNAR